ncbi:scavenger mRNA decapping enzyme [Crassisporium funariophilum]|nr:scavenger mRNA decapping enzyme [Crassisporium funariophilum]
MSYQLPVLNDFSFEKVINEDPLTHSLILLGTFPSPDDQNLGEKVKAIVRIEKTALDPGDAPRFFGETGLINRAVVEGATDIYTWFFGWLADDRERDVKINIICPATDVHIRKYMKQEQVIVHETPALYEEHVKPYISSFPASRTKWVDDILLGLSEQSKVLYSSPEFLILPDMKWDLKTITSLYLVAIVQDRTIRSLRDLRKNHVGLLKSIRREATHVVKERWGLGNGSLRMYIHYQPSYYHFHVHIVNANFQGFGMNVGQSHILDDVTSLLELDPDDGPGIFERMTLTYGLGDQHGLYEVMRQSHDGAV